MLIYIFCYQTKPKKTFPLSYFIWFFFNFRIVLRGCYYYVRIIWQCITVLYPDCCLTRTPSYWYFVLYIVSDRFTLQWCCYVIELYCYILVFELHVSFVDMTHVTPIWHITCHTDMTHHISHRLTHHISHRYDTSHITPIWHITYHTDMTHITAIY